MVRSSAEAVYGEQEINLILPFSQLKLVQHSVWQFFHLPSQRSNEIFAAFLGDYQLQPSKAKRVADWNHAGGSGSINQYTVSSIRHCCKRSGIKERWSY